MDSLIQWGLGIVLWVQTFRNPILDEFFLRINVLGDEEFYILLLPILFWCLSKRIGMRLGFLFLFSMYLNQVLKDFFAAPRPYQVDSKLYSPVKQSGYGIPSGHAQGTTTVWGYIATQLGSFWWGIAIAIPLLVSIGRMYLGDHFPQDVIAGAIIGIILVAAYAILEPRVTPWLIRQNRGIKLGLAAGVPLVLAVLHLTTDTATVLGTLLGFYVGLVFEEDWFAFDARNVWWKQIVKFALAIVIVLGLRFGLKAVFPATAVFDMLRYTIIGLWVGLGAPWLFVSIGLAKSAKGIQAPTGTSQPRPSPF